jgi:hypothetical protein
MNREDLINTLRETQDTLTRQCSYIADMVSGLERGKTQPEDCIKDMQDMAEDIAERLDNLIATTRKLEA